MRKKLFAVGVCGWMGVAPLQATVVIPASLEELSREAHIIARGRVVATEAVAAGDWRTIETIVTLETEAALKGSAQSTMQFRMPGGQLGRYRHVVIGAPEFRAGQRIIVFLTSRGTDHPYVIGLGLGVFRLVERSGQWVVTPPPAMRTAPGSQAIVRGDPSRRPPSLAEFERQVRSFAGGPR